MSHASPSFLTSEEAECLTVVEGSDDSADTEAHTAGFFAEMRSLAPSLPGPSGFFNAYGRVYLDGAHVEFAACECDSPYALPIIVEQQQQLTARAVTQLADRGIRIILANNNHSGLLREGAATWGTHENYLVEQPPSPFGPLILPFLATRVYAGAGGLLYPSGDFVAGVRINFLDLDAGGGTTHERAAHSTARTEHLMGNTRHLYRYHTLLGDGNRSHFSQALKHGTTLLALKAIFFNPDLLEPLPGTPAPHRRRRAFWMRAMRQFNVLASPGQPPRVPAVALQIQRLYLEGARRFADAQRELPPWVPHLLQDWDELLKALARDDRPWLATRLDPWIKYELYTAALQERGCTMKELLRNEDVFYDLALLDQNYHEFCNSDCIFTKLENAGALCHRVADALTPGTEPEPYVPQTGTRARARARFIRAHSGDTSLCMNWEAVHDTRRQRRRSLADPFAQEYSRCEPGGL